MTANPQSEGHGKGGKRRWIVFVVLGFIAVGALIWTQFGSVNDQKDPAANAALSSPTQTDGTTSPTLEESPASTSTAKETPPEISGEASLPTEAENNDPNAVKAAPVTKFEDAMPTDWPKGKTTGCSYVVDRLEQIHSDVETSGIEAMRKWLDAIDDLQGDASMLDHSMEFDAVKRTWSTALSMAEEPENSDAKQSLKDGSAALYKLTDGIDCS